MATEKGISVFERVTKTVKGKPISSLKKIETDGTLEAIKKAIASLQKSGVSYFEVVDPKKGTKTQYFRTLSGKNYQVKVLKVK